jgi:hypothetical protein
VYLRSWTQEAEGQARDLSSPGFKKSKFNEEQNISNMYTKKNKKYSEYIFFFLEFLNSSERRPVTTFFDCPLPP